MTSEEYQLAVEITLNELRNLNKVDFIEDFEERLVNLKDVIAIVKKNLIR